MIRITYFWHFLQNCMLPKPWKYFLTVTKIFRVMFPKFWYFQQKCMQMHVGNWHQHAYLHAHGCTCIQNASSISLLKWPKCMHFSKNACIFKKCMHFLLIKCMHKCMHFCGKYQLAELVVNGFSFPPFNSLSSLTQICIECNNVSVISIEWPNNSIGLITAR